MFLQRLLLVCIIFNSTVIISCSPCPDPLEYVKFENMSTTSWKRESEQIWYEVEEAELVDWDDLKLECKLSGTFYAQGHQITNGNGLYAKCLHDGYLGSQDGINNLYLITLTDYNESFEANDTLNEIVKVGLYKKSESMSGPLIDFVNSRRDNLQENHFFLSFNEAPSQQDFQQFKIVLELENGDVLESKTEEVNLGR